MTNDVARAAHTTFTPPAPLASKSMAELVAIYNKLSPEKPAGAKTFSQRSKIIARIEEMMAEQQKALDALKAKPATPALKKALVTVGELADKQRTEMQSAVEVAPLTTKDIPPATKVKVRLVRVVAETLLLQDDPALSYQQILDKIKEEFPLGQTSIACLRWYSVQLRERGEQLPDRPRPIRVKKVALTEEAKKAVKVKAPAEA